MKTFGVYSLFNQAGQIHQNLNKSITIITKPQMIISSFLLLFHSNRFKGRTPLHMACNMKQFECARILVSFGCKVSAFDLLGRLPIIEAARLREAATLNLLLKANGPSYSQEFLGIKARAKFFFQT